MARISTGVGENFAAALESLKPERIVGRGRRSPLATRPWRPAKSDTDYLMFGDLEPGGENAAELVLERAAWWAEIVQCALHWRGA